MRVQGDCDFTTNIDGCNDDDVKEAAGGTAYTGNYEYWCPSFPVSYGAVSVALPDRITAPSELSKRYRGSMFKNRYRGVTAVPPSDVVTVPSEWVLGVAALVTVLITVNVTCLVMARMKRGTPKMDFEI